MKSFIIKTYLLIAFIWFLHKKNCEENFFLISKNLPVSNKDKMKRKDSESIQQICLNVSKTNIY